MSLAQFISDAPPGELSAVKSDILTLADGNHAVIQALARETENYNTQTLKIVKVNGKSAILCAANKFGRNEFYSQGSTFKVDHDTGTTSNCKPGTSLSEQAHSLLAALEPYIKEHYPNDYAFDVFDSAAVDEASEGDIDNSKLTVAIVGRRINPTNYLSGQWTALYTVSRQLDKLEGKIDVDVHYYEEGNARLRTSTSTCSTVSGQGAAAIVEAISATEDKFEKDLNSTLVGLNEQEFKALRRQLPVTRTQMVWGKAVNAYRVGRELEQR